MCGCVLSSSDVEFKAMEPCPLPQYPVLGLALSWPGLEGLLLGSGRLEFLLTILLFLGNRVYVMACDSVFLPISKTLNSLIGREIRIQNSAPKIWKFCAHNLQILRTICCEFCALFKADFPVLKLSVAFLYNSVCHTTLCLKKHPRCF